MFIATYPRGGGIYLEDIDPAKSKKYVCAAWTASNNSPLTQMQLVQGFDCISFNKTQAQQCTVKFFDIEGTQLGTTYTFSDKDTWVDVPIPQNSIYCSIVVARTSLLTYVYGALYTKNSPYNPL